MDENRARRVADALRDRGIDAHLARVGVYQSGVRVSLPDGREAMWDSDGSADPEAPTLKVEGSALTGVKIAVPNADVADVLVVTAEGGRHFLVQAADATIEKVPEFPAARPMDVA